MTKTVVKNVRVHSCYSIEMCEPRPTKCLCKELISVWEAEDRVRKGLAQYVIGYDRKSPYEDGRQICMIGRSLRTPRGATIEKAHMERAYLFGGDLEEKTRIDMYGFLTLMARVMIGKNNTFIPIGFEPEGGRENDWGVPVLYLPGEGRTEGGYAPRK